MPIKPYSFRYPYNLTSVYRPWWKTLKDGYDKVVSDLTERDNLLEDHLNLGVGQGYLAMKYLPTGNFALPAGVNTDIPGLAITYTVPANRQILITVGVRVIAASATPTSQIRILDQNNVVYALDYYNHGTTGTAASVYNYHIKMIYTPTPGTHTMRVQGNSLVGATTLETIAQTVGTSNSYIAAEDIGPRSLI